MMRKPPQRGGAILCGGGPTLDDYSHFHQNRFNLLIHIVAVPFFVVTALAALWCLASGQRAPAAVLALGPPLSLAAQGHGHRREANPPRPFRGPLDFTRRILTEQFVRFPAFVATGRFARALRESTAQPADLRPISRRRSSR